MTKHDVEYLRGNKTYWDVKGAAWNIVAEFCRKRNYGTFGQPTEAGNAAIKKWEQEHRL